MIRTERDYLEAQKQMEGDRAFAAQQHNALREMGLSEDEIEQAMAPTRAFHAQLEEEVQWYERVSAGEVTPIRNLTQIGRLLIALRIAQKMSQRDLAKALGVNESQVSRDERNEYHGVTFEKAQRVIEALGVEATTIVERERLVPA